MAFLKKLLLVQLFLAAGFLSFSSQSKLSGIIFANRVYAESKVFIDIGKAKIKKNILALPKFILEKSDSKTQSSSKKIYKILRKDISFSNLFDFIEKNALLSPIKSTKPSSEEKNGFLFSELKSIGAEFLAVTKIDFKKKKIVLKCFFYRISDKKLLFSKEYTGDDLSGLAHSYANDIIEGLTGKKSIFFTKFVFVRRQKNKQYKAIYTMNWDGANLKRISKIKGLAFSPTWSPDRKKIAYTAFVYHRSIRMKNADIFFYNTESKKTSLALYKRGVNSGSNFHPNNNSLVFSLSRRGSADIRWVRLSGSHIKNFTKGPTGAANISPSVSPKGDHLAFISDRSGRPMLYIMDINRGSTRRLTFAGKYNASPAWSPDGKTLAFSSFHKGSFDIFSISVTGGNLKKLTSSYKSNGKPANSESPSFSPDGRHIVFNNNRTGINQLYVMTVDGKQIRQITFGNHDSTQPEWSPY